MIIALVLGCTTGYPPHPRDRTEAPDIQPSTGPYTGPRYIDQVRMSCSTMSVYLSGRTSLSDSRVDVIVSDGPDETVHEVPLETVAASPTHAWHHLRAEGFPVSLCEEGLHGVVRVYDADTLVDCRIWGESAWIVPDALIDGLRDPEELQRCELGLPLGPYL